MSDSTAAIAALRAERHRLRERLVAALDLVALLAADCRGRRLALTDVERAQLQAALADRTALRHRPWWNRPDLLECDAGLPAMLIVNGSPRFHSPSANPFCRSLLEALRQCDEQPDTPPSVKPTSNQVIQ